MGSVENLKAKLEELEGKIKLLTTRNIRGKIETMSSEVVDSNPYR